MRRIIAVLVITFLFAGCADGKFHRKTLTAGPCGTTTGYTYTGIAYGDSKLMVIPISKIRANTEWRFYLLPIDSLGGATAYGDAMVTIDGKPAPYVPPNPPANDDWLKVEGTYNLATVSGRAHYISLCVDADVVPGQQWQFLVDVDTIGHLDPRGHVEE